MAKVVLGCPMYDYRLGYSSSERYFRQASRNHQMCEVPADGSIIDSQCTKLWCDALNNRHQGVTYFAMLHSDVTPEPWWVDTLIEQAELHGADFVSALVAVKNLSGAYSTGISTSDGERHFRRLSRRQVQHPDFPTTFGIEEAATALERLPEPLRIPEVPRGGFLLANTGCMVCRVDRPWAEHVVFNSVTVIEKFKGGVVKPYTFSEDWYFTRGIAQHGGRVMATKTVATSHMGTMHYASEGDWGQDQDDESREWWRGRNQDLQH
jgi:hypothetical protein